MHASNLACLIDTINSSFNSNDFSKEDFKSPDTINSKSSQLLYEEEEENDSDSENSMDSCDNEETTHEENQHANRRRKSASNDRVTRCRERNRIHARNTRERKKAQMDDLQTKVQKLLAERDQLQLMAVDTSVAGILMSLAGINSLDDSENKSESCSNLFSSSFRNDLAKKFEELQNEASRDLSDEEALDLNKELLGKDRSECTTQELEIIRRERNRLHAKRTRLRKKIMLQISSMMVTTLEDEIKSLRNAFTGNDPNINEIIKMSSPWTKEQEKIYANNSKICDGWRKKAVSNKTKGKKRLKSDNDDSVSTVSDSSHSREQRGHTKPPK